MSKWTISCSQKCELAGLAFVLISTIWQLNFSGWWDTTLVEQQNFIQEDVNFSLLRNQAELANLIKSGDLTSSEIMRTEIVTRSFNTINAAIEKRDERIKSSTNGQASLFNKIKAFLMIAGAFMLVLGKYLSLRESKV